MVGAIYGNRSADDSAQQDARVQVRFKTQVPQLRPAKRKRADLAEVSPERFTQCPI